MRQARPKGFTWGRARHAVEGREGEKAGGKRLRQILVIGHDDEGCTPAHERAAYEAGAEIARSGSVLVTGGMGGVMRASCRGASEAGGMTVGILPQDDPGFANEHCRIVIPTGMGMARDFVNALSADGIIVIGGGSGTLSEVCAGYMHRKPMVAIRGTGGVADRYADSYVDHRGSVRVVGAPSPREAVGLILAMIGGTGGGRGGGGPAPPHAMDSSSLSGL